MTSRDPETPEEWQDAVDWSSFYIHLESARLYGLVKGGPKVNVDRCEEILERGRQMGVYPSTGHIERCTKKLLVANG